MKTITINTLLIAILCLGIWACRHDKSTPNDVDRENARSAYDRDAATNNNKDTEFIKEASESSQLEVQLASIALEKSTSSEVKKFAQKMLSDHTKAFNELDSLAMNMGLSVASDSLPRDSQKKVDELASKTGEDFDKAYCKMMVKGHKESIDNFQDQADSGEDIQLQRWAQEKLPVLEHHLAMARNLEDNIKTIDSRK